MHQLILASQSPRRSELLKSLGYQFTVDSVKVSELFDKNLNEEAALIAIAQTKVEALLKSGKYLKSKDLLILGADTMVFLEGQALGKPSNEKSAIETLRLLSRKTHRVITALVVWDSQRAKIFSAADKTLVKFRQLSEDEILAYVKSGEPMDKAGAYGIQGRAKEFIVERVGSWSNVVGLPLELWEEMVRKNGWNIARTKIP